MLNKEFYSLLIKNEEGVYKVAEDVVETLEHAKLAFGILVNYAKLGGITEEELKEYCKVVKLVEVEV